ncbi:hypothetical protein NPIL_346191 [Nephila pilipes]|uniref:DUF4773 domain-containing protein n=1 Tax=Nephila pilipes TaxID=299642 RepID=A0A8X6N8F2_NEPPI|nr:hypothetical protein NPIL_346191 [Nephila pilipes]
MRDSKRKSAFPMLKLFRNPPPICLPLPFLKKYVHLCLSFYNLTWAHSEFGACTKIELLIWHLCEVGNFKLGCFDTGTRRVSGPTLTRIVVRPKREALDMTDMRKHQTAVTEIRKHQVSASFPFNICSSSSRNMPNYYQLGLMIFVFLFVFKAFQASHSSSYLYKTSLK